MPLVTIKDVAQATGFSIATVSNALNSKGRLGEATRRKIFDACQRLGYSPNSAGRNLRRRLTETIGLLFYPGRSRLFSNVYYAEVVEAFEKRLEAAHFDLLLASFAHRATETGLPRFIRQGKVDGFVALGYFPEPAIQLLATARCPFVLLDYHATDIPLDSITTDGFNGVRKAVLALAELGHCEFVFLSPVTNHTNCRNRLLGFDFGLKEAGISPSSIHRLLDYKDPEKGLDLLRDLLPRLPSPPAIITVNDTWARLYLDRLQREGFSFPRDASWVGFDNNRFCETLNPPLSAVGADRAALGSGGAELILRRIAQPDAPIQNLVLPTSLFLRASVAPRP